VFRGRIVDLPIRLVPPDRRRIVPARVALPVKLHFVSATQAAAFEGDPILRWARAAGPTSRLRR